MVNGDPSKVPESTQWSPKSHKNPCSMAALLCGTFGSWVDLVKTFTKIHAVLLQNSLQVSHCFFCVWKNMFCDIAKFPPKYMQVCYKYSTKVCLLGKIPLKFTYLENIHMNLRCWKISTKKHALLVNLHKKTFFVGKFPQKLSFIWKNSTTNCLVGK